MSILGANANSILLNLLAAIYFGLLLASVFIASALKVFRANAVVGPERLSRRQSPWPLVAAVGAGLLIWVMVQALYGDIKGIHSGQHAAPGKPIVFSFTPRDWAFLATVPALVGVATLLTMDFAVGGFVLIDRLGFSLKKALPGIGKGIVAAIVILPPTYFLSSITELLYKRFGYEHPAEHELLKVMNLPEIPVVHWLLILGAVLVAPLWEEFLFRGHIQTLIRRTLVTLSSPRLPGMEGLGGYTPMNLPIEQPTVPLSYESQIDNTLYVWQTWLAIFLTSIIFAMMHPMWMRPPIFILSLGLGYCYERTGNLWANMTVHCLFNSISTFLFLTVIH